MFAMFPPKYPDFRSIPTDYFIGHSLALQSFVMVSGSAGRLIPQAVEPAFGDIFHFDQNLTPVKNNQHCGP
jgi:hypothetical protein